MAEKTKAELEQENADLRAYIADLEAGMPAAVTTAQAAPVLPSFGMSEGTRNDIEQAQHEIARNPKVDEIVFSEPFAGHTVTVTEGGHDISERPQAGETVLGTIDQFED